MIKLGVDVMGYENDLSHSINACRDFLKKYKDVQIVLFGDKELISPFLNSENEFEIIHSSEFISQNDTILSARRKPNSSMQLAANYLNENKIDGVLSAGSTPVFVMTMYNTIGLINGVSKPGFMPTIPTVKSIPFNLLDVGASLDVNEIDLAKFAIMANVYAKQRTENPKVGILNIGTESHKGPAILHKTNEILNEYQNINNIGFIESKNLLEYCADVVVTDGFTGNIVLKACEGSVKTIAHLIKENIKKPRNFLPLLFSANFLKKIFNKFDYKNNAGAFVMGLKKICVKTHGSADYKQFYSSLEMLHNSVKNSIIKNIENEISIFNDFLIDKGYIKNND